MIKYIFGLFIILGLAAAAWLYELYDEIKHDIDSVVNYMPKQSTQFFDKDGKLLANTFKEENEWYFNLLFHEFMIYIISFLAGILTILAPCALPMIPVICGR